MTRQLDLDMPLLALARATDPATAKAAAASVNTGDLERKVLVWLRQHPRGGTSEEIADGLGIARVSISPRLRPLLNKGKVRDSGEKRLSSSGRPCIVWVDWPV